MTHALGARLECGACHLYEERTLEEKQLIEHLRKTIRDVPDFPSPGILFRDITPVLQNGALFQALINFMAKRYQNQHVDLFVGIESRGFLLAAPIAAQLGCGMVLARKPGKLPYKTKRQAYSLEYGKDALEIHEDAIRQGARVVVIDDLLATGGTIQAACGLISSMGGEIVEASVLVELSGLGGRSRLAAYPLHALMTYS